MTSSADILRGFAPAVPDALVTKAEGWKPGSKPAVAQPAASVILLREDPELETYLLHRHARMAFAASMVVFPGGRMDPIDRSHADPWRACAVRETTEETGVVLALADLLAWADWTTPTFEPRRYETRFYVALLPAGQWAEDLSGETDAAGWSTPTAALTAAEAGTLGLMPPTRSILMELAELGSIAAVLVAADGRTVVPILPVLVRDPAGWRFRYPIPRGWAVNRIVNEPALRCLLAPNPGPMTLDGTNTWIVGDPAARPPVVVDPGPDDPAHLADVLSEAGGRIAVVVLTHRHLDHTAGAANLADAAGCEVRAVDPVYRVGPAGLSDGDVVEVGDAWLEVIATPGHTDDSVSLLLGSPSSTRLFTGDSVLGRGTSVIAAPDGDLAAYLESLQRMLRLVSSRQVTHLLPGHGPVIDRPREVLEDYLEHRRLRLAHVREALRAGAVTARDVVEMVYADVDRALWAAAEQSVQAQLRYLPNPLLTFSGDLVAISSGSHSQGTGNRAMVEDMSQPHGPNPPQSSHDNGDNGLNTPPFYAYQGHEPTVPIDRVPGFQPYDFPAPAGVPPLASAPATATATRPRRGLATVLVAASLSAVIGAGAGIGSYAVLGGNTPSAGSPISVTNTPASTTPKLDGTVASAAAKIDPSVVTISVTTGQGAGLGTGVVLDTEGHILTNDHVVSGAGQGGTIRVSFDDGSTADATLVGTAPDTDLAVIKVAASAELTPATFAKSGEVSVGQSVVAVGAPLGLSDTVTSGIVSNTTRPVRSGTNNDAVYLAVQTDAAINPGNSGGPLVDLNGSVVGINSAIASTGSTEGGQSGNIGIGFAIPADVAVRVAGELIKNQSAPRATLGVNLEGAGTDATPAAGVALDQVVSGGAADKAGLRTGDVVTKLNDFPTTTADGWIAATRYYAPGTSVQITYERDGQSRTAEVTLGSS